MHPIWPYPTLLLMCVAFGTGLADAQQPAAASAETKIRNALSAAPPAIVVDAAVMDWDNTPLRPGTNGWTCLPDPPDGPGDTPVCMNSQALNWLEAWKKNEDPQLTQIGIAYQLQGGFAASNTDPYATEPLPGEDWITHGPHVLITVPDVDAFKNMSTNPSSDRPWVMWQGTRYAHLHIPLTNSVDRN